MSKIQRTIVFFIFTITLFAIGRAHFFYMPGNYGKNFDGAWHYAYQAQILREENGRQSNEYQKSRHEFRTFQDRWNAEITIKFSKLLDISLLEATTLLSSIIYLLAIVNFLILGRYVMDNDYLAFVFAFLSLQSPYGGWLAWSAAVTKMWAFALLPILFIFMLELAKNKWKTTPTILFLFFMACLYAPTMLYISPAVFGVVLMDIYLADELTRKEKQNRILSVICGALLLAVVIFLSKPSAVGSGLPEQFYLHFYGERAIWWYPLFGLNKHALQSLMYFLLPGGLALGMSWWFPAAWRRTTWMAVGAFLLLLLTGQMDSWLSYYFPMFRSTAMFRAVYYTYIPGMIFIGLALRWLWNIIQTDIPSTATSQETTRLKAKKAVSLMGLIFILVTLTFNKENQTYVNIQSASGIWKQILTGKVDKNAKLYQSIIQVVDYLNLLPEWERLSKGSTNKSVTLYQDIVQVADFLNTLPPDIKILLPATKWQRSDFDMHLEALTGKNFTPMFMDTHLIFIEHKLSRPYYELDVKLQRLADIDSREKALEYLQIAQEEHADYILLATEWIQTDFPIAPAFKNKRWAILSTQTLADTIASSGN